MALLGVLSVIGVLFWFAAIGGVILAGFNSSRGRAARPGIVLVVLGVIGGIIFTVVNQGLVLVQPNERAVVFRQIGGRGLEGSLREEPLGPGLNWIIPFVETSITYDVARQNVTMAGTAAEAGGQAGVQSSVRGRSQDGQEVQVDVTVLYVINPLQVNDVHINWRRTFETNFIVAQTRSVLRDKIADFTAEAIYAGGRTAIQLSTADTLQPIFSEEGFDLIDVLIRDVTFAPEFADAIERKQIAEQEAQRAVFLVQEQEQEAARVIVEAEGRASAEIARAEGDATAIVIRAEGNAEAIVIEAEADAEALRLVNEEITKNPNLIQFRYITELADNVQLVIIPSNSPFLFDFQTLADQSPLPPPAPVPSDESGG